MTRFYLVRHGQIERSHVATDGDIADPPLSPQGRREAKAVAVYLASQPVARIYSSPLRRAQESAVPMAAASGLSIIVEPRLRERMNFGDLPGQSLEQFVALWERCSRERDFVPPVGDSSRAAGSRVEAWMHSVSAEYPADGIVAFGHGGVIADFLLNLCPLPTLTQISAAFASQPYSGDVMRNGAITIVDCTVECTATTASARPFVIEAIALTQHLDAI